jgi:competence protein ComEC
MAGTAWWNQRCFRVVFLSVGQGDGCIVHTPEGLNLMIDGGATGNDSVGSYVLSPALKYYGMSELDYIFISHTDTDHVNGILYLLENGELLGYRVHYLVFAEGVEEDENFCLLKEAAEKIGAELLYVSRGDTLQYGELEIDLLYPTAPENNSEDSTGNGTENNTGNDYSLVFTLNYGGLSVLFTGDISSEVEGKLLTEVAGEAEKRKEKGACLLLKVPHHGSKYSSSADFLEAFAGDLAVISCGKNNSYGHPAEATLNRLWEAGYDIFRTDESGALIVEF